jgi:hypothetical protein
MGDNPIENNQKLLRNKEKTPTGSKLNGDWRGNQCDLLGKINHLWWRSILLRKYELHLGRPKLCWGQGCTATNSAGEKEISSNGDQTLRRGTESTQTSRVTQRVNCLGNHRCFTLKDLLFTEMLLIFFLLALQNFFLLYIKENLILI